MSRRDITQVSVLTPSGRGAVAVVAVEGKAAVTAVDRYFRAANQLALSDQPIGRIVYGHWVSDPRDNRNGEDLIVCRRSDESLEIHCHGGRQSSAQIIADLAAAGCTVIDADAWLANQYACPLAAAAHLAMTQATTLRTAQILLDQHHGVLRCEIEAILSALAENETTAATAQLERLLLHAELGRHLIEPWRVVIAGQPNVGKSSLINAMVGFERAIVFDQPGTTRDVVSSATAIEGWPVLLSDTAGLHETTDTIETAGILLASKQISDADLVVWVLDAVGIDFRGEYSIWALAQQQAEAVGVQLDPKQTQIVINKIDLTEFPKEINLGSVGTCAVTGAGVAQLLATIAARLVPNIPSPNTAVPFTSEQIDALQRALDAARREDFSAASERLFQMI